MKILTVSVSDRNNNNKLPFKRKVLGVRHVKETPRYVKAEEKLEQIFGENTQKAQKLLQDLLFGKEVKSDGTLKLVHIDRQTSVVKNSADEILLSLKKSTTFAENPDVKKSAQALKCTTHEISDSNNNLIQTAKSYSNNEGRYKVEIYDADGRFTDEFLGTRYYFEGKTSPSPSGKPTYIKPVKNQNLASGGHEHIKYYPDSLKTGYLEKDAIDHYGSLIDIRIPVLREGQLAGIQVLSPSRKHLRTIALNETALKKEGNWRDFSGKTKLDYKG